ncbi:MAG TPA: hypothetical protein VFA20_29275 [Myxococcaceae bacterium]|nr:hypothetical protein [Myxococcaceae bacterium]
MQRHLFTAAVGLAAVAAALGCSHSSGKFKELGVDEVVQLQALNPVTFADANTVDFRKENGVIPGAILLDSSSKYDVSVLPKDKAGALVFYCSNRL